ncbi:nitrate reductase molybdenum cofactor assembly chaperone [Streptomyces sp. HUAS TT20]|uniref:nitrate reductase molybdenum cofactor assembly chaperone n=1 Tax=Streptomyces sp. HUAS TT20 TaxID=3447509 RepID=UPI0021DB050D|nr:nitrate reductase molybdenum cofactor assembly chaperone [Streptomyces sp. HUAS 15-9]UXY25315.1 nitrate reductase molybdenum cofactor assembly chaperone [Streptomyces sp. HUAS 15-9]
MIPRRARRAEADTPLVHRITSVLLRYPDETVLTCLDDVAAVLPSLADAADRARLAAVCDHLRCLPPNEAAQRYVETFDHTRSRSLHLTYYRHGDTRARGMALLALKHAYRQAGHEPPEAELPDFLPLILEFAAVAPEPGHRILLQCQAGLELLRQALHEHSTPYAGVIDTLCGRLPEPTRRERDTWRRLAAEGPPGEHVGLEPFGPPEHTGLDPHPAPGRPVPLPYPTTRAFLSAKESR